MLHKYVSFSLDKRKICGIKCSKYFSIRENTTCYWKPSWLLTLCNNHVVSKCWHQLRICSKPSSMNQRSLPRKHEGFIKNKLILSNTMNLGSQGIYCFMRLPWCNLFTLSASYNIANLMLSTDMFEERERSSNDLLDKWRAYSLSSTSLKKNKCATRNC